jgi:flavin reductase ActVB
MSSIHIAAESASLVPMDGTIPTADGFGTDLREPFRDAMSRLAAAVVMVTARVDGRPWGLTISSCCSVSLDPPLLLVSLHSSTASAQSIAKNGFFGIDLLGEGGVDAARFGAAKGAPKFVEELCHPAPPNGDARALPAVIGSLAHIDCEVEHTYPVADHVIVVGRVSGVALPPDGPPLLYHSRGYRRLGDTAGT